MGLEKSPLLRLEACKPRLICANATRYITVVHILAPITAMIVTYNTPTTRNIHYSPLPHDFAYGTFKTGIW